MTPTQRAQIAHRAKQREAGYRPITVWITTDAHAWLHSMALNRSISVASMVERLVMEREG